jgi:hypothetical protein
MVQKRKENAKNLKVVKSTIIKWQPSQKENKTE